MPHSVAPKQLILGLQGWASIRDPKKLRDHFFYVYDAGRVIPHTAALGFMLRSRTWPSSALMTSTAMLSTPSLVCGFSDLAGFNIMQTRPSSLSASLMSRMRIRSRALFEYRRSLSLGCLESPSSSDDVTLDIFLRLVPPPPPRWLLVVDETLGRGEEGSDPKGEVGLLMSPGGCLKSGGISGGGGLEE